MEPPAHDADVARAVVGLVAHRADAGPGFPRCVLLLLAEDGAGTAVARALSTLPPDLADLFAVVQVLVHGSTAEFLRRAPFQLAQDDRRFDTQLLVQARALGIRPREAPIDGWPEAPGFSTRQSLGVALDYRLHQMHVLRLGEYLVDHGVHYTLKKSPASSRAQILAAIRPDTRVLDLGCSQGLLARDLRAKGVHVTGVDVLPPDRVSAHLSAYHQRDLKEPLRLREGRVYDGVLVSDVIEHVKNRGQLLRSARRHLKPDGRLLISTPNIAIWFYRLSLLAGRFEYGPRGILDETHVHLFTQATFRRLVESSGFRIVAQRTTALPFEVMLESTGRSRPVAFLSWSYHRLTRLWPRMFAYPFLFEAEVATLLDEAEADADAN